MLHEFVSSNREELIRRCTAKVNQRSSPPVTLLKLEHGVPLFLDQLVEALRYDHTNPEEQFDGSSATSAEKAALTAASGIAALHGDELFAQGYTVSQVVHGYGDVCQALTELAIEKNAAVTVREFRTLNSLLDNAIADAVSSYVHYQASAVSEQGAHDLHAQLGSLADEQRELLNTALNALQAIKLGNIGLIGATGTILEDSLMKLRELIETSLPEIRLSTGMTRPVVAVLPASAVQPERKSSADDQGMTLAEFIVRSMEKILAAWEDFARSIPAAETLDRKALRDHAEKMLKAIAHDLVQFQSAAQQSEKSKGRAPEPVRKDDTAATSHGTDRYTAGFDLKALVSEYRALRATVVRLWTPDVCSDDRETQLSRFNEAIDQALHESVLRYSEEVGRSRELFLGVVGHDLRTPLGAILHSAQYLLQSEGLSGEQVKASARVHSSGTRIQQILSDLLDVTRTRLGGALPLELKPMDLSDMSKHVTEEAQAFHPACTILWSTTGDCRGTWDETRLYQLLSNLVENAIRHGAPDKPVRVATMAQADEVEVTVHNEGAPIPPSEIRAIFEPMRQGQTGSKRAEGLGLGLYIARAIATAHHGAINVESTIQAGTTFTVHLPKQQHPASSPERRSQQSGRRLGDG